MKHNFVRAAFNKAFDAPHTGARLETVVAMPWLLNTP